MPPVIWPLHGRYRWLVLTNKIEDYVDEDGEEREDLDPPCNRHVTAM